MALLFPSFEEINRMNPESTEGELCLLKFLYYELDDSYEVYFQPLLNGDNPDIIIMRKNSGVLI